MKPITYLCFTLLSILIQFCLMDFINDRIQIDSTHNNHERTVARNLSNILKNIKETPHALYYRNKPQKLEKEFIEVQVNNFSNLSLPVSSFTTTTDFPSTVFDLLYDENVSMTDISLITDAYYNSEYDNVTEITMYDKKTTIKPTEITKKKISTDNCGCDLLFNKCDVGCCCDSECSDIEHNLFENCIRANKGICFNYNKKLQYFCFLQRTCSREFTSNTFEHYFCIDKVNLPNKRILYKKELENTDINKYFRWHTIQGNGALNKFTKAMYVYRQPVWFLKNETLDIISLPITVTNSYCSGKKPIKFLTNEHIKCYVKIKDLYFLYALQVSTESNVVSPTLSTSNSTTLNCSTLYCSYWTILVCDEYNCIHYNKDLHEPTCSDSHCDNIGVKVEYIFNCNGSIITNATLKLYVKQVSMNNDFVTQEVVVTFYMGNDSSSDIIKYSGNPGYIKGLPVLVSFFEGNHTDYFYKRPYGERNNILLPNNQNGRCVLTNITHNIVKFGINKRIKCRLTLGKSDTIYNKTDGCLIIQMKMIELLRLNENIFISPYGNPNGISDNKWISLQKLNKSNVYGIYHLKNSELQCYNLITQFVYTLTYADINGVSVEENKIFSARVQGTSKNVTFNVNELSTVVTVDINFIEVSTPDMRGYIGTTHLNTHLPKNFFLPYHSHCCKFIHTNLFYLYLCTILFLSK